MNTKFFVGLLILCAGVLAGWYFLGGKLLTYPGITMDASKKTETVVTPTTRPSSVDLAPSEEVEKGGSASRSVVTYTDSGFAPSPLVVKKGTTVTFVNESSSLMLVASAIYPTHSLLPDFVQKTQVTKGKSYEYTFTKVGTWRYQNDVLTKDVGTISVTE